jgi:hypothetical protein
MSTFPVGFSPIRGHEKVSIGWAKTYWRQFPVDFCPSERPKKSIARMGKNLLEKIRQNQLEKYFSFLISNEIELRPHTLHTSFIS